MTEKKATLFTFLNQIQQKNRTISYDKKIAGSYILTLFLSMDSKLINKVNDINKYLFILPDEVVYEYYMNVIPAGKKYLKFTKKRTEDDKIKKRIDELKEIYPEMSIKEIKLLINYLMKEENK